MQQLLKHKINKKQQQLKTEAIQKGYQAAQIKNKSPNEMKQ